jgi:hypothetical protein
MYRRLVATVVGTNQRRSVCHHPITFILYCIKFSKTVVCPVIDVINDRTFAYQKGIELFRGGFNWNLQFRWFSVPPAEVKKRAGDGTLPIAYV